MPSLPQRPCNKTGCRELTTGRYCDTHVKTESQALDKQRGTREERGYGYKWRKVRVSYLARNPLCVHCQEKGLLRVATEIDHIRAHKGNQTLFWDVGNWQSLCKSCHSIKTNKFDK